MVFFFQKKVTCPCTTVIIQTNVTALNIVKIPNANTNMAHSIQNYVITVI